jgi:hypothetical protein
MHMLSLCAPLMLLTACPGDPASGTGDGTGTDGITSAGPDATSASTLSSSSATSASTSTSDATSGPFPTTGEETSGGCVDASDCDNGIFCDGVESCVDQVCVSGDPVDCTDAVDCTADACDLRLRRNL